MTAITKELTIPLSISREAVETLSALKREPDWMLDRRLLAWRFFEEIPMPTGMEETWRRTRLTGFKLDAVQPFAPARDVRVAKQTDLPAAIQAELATLSTNAGAVVHRDADLLFSSLRPDLEAKGVIFCDLHTAVREHPDLVQKYFMSEAVALPDDDKFAALHAALWNGGTFLYVPRGVTVDTPLQGLIALDQAGVGNFSHTIIVAEAGAEVTYLEEMVSLQDRDNQDFHSGIVEIIAQPAARVNYISLQSWGSHVYNFSRERAVVGRDAHVRWVTSQLGSRLTKTFQQADLLGAGASSEMLGVLFAAGRQHIDLDTYQRHVAPNTVSDLLYKGALRDRAHAVWRGMIRVEPNAQKTNGYQKNQNLILSKQARADSVPGLEISADDVRCTHGVTVSQVEPEYLFYLMSRGLNKEQAEHMIVAGFFEEVLARIPLEGVREKLEAAIGQRIGI